MSITWRSARSLPRVGARGRARFLVPRIYKFFTSKSRARGFIPGDHRQWKRGLGNPRSERVGNFWKLRLSTLLWGFAVSLIFTGSLVTAVPMFAVIVAGNTVLMWYFR